MPGSQQAPSGDVCSSLGATLLLLFLLTAPKGTAATCGGSKGSKGRRPGRWSLEPAQRVYSSATGLLAWEQRVGESTWSCRAAGTAGQVSLKLSESEKGGVVLVADKMEGWGAVLCQNITTLRKWWGAGRGGRTPPGGQGQASHGSPVCCPRCAQPRRVHVSHPDPSLEAQQRRGWGRGSAASVECNDESG